MALLLRMGGVPARVATGFTSGSLDSKTREYVVRDLDAHSWVEVWYPRHRLGHLRPDAGLRAAARAAERGRRERRARSAASARRASAAATAPSDPRPARAAVHGRDAVGLDRGSRACVVLVLAGAAFVLLRRRRRRAATPPPAIVLAELERALRRTRRHPGPGATLNSSSSASPAAPRPRATSAP